VTGDELAYVLHSSCDRSDVWTDAEGFEIERDGFFWWGRDVLEAGPEW
jgi:hypothetical protein